MKLEINLLPPDFKTSRRRQLYGRGIRQLLVRLDVGLVVVGLIFGGVYAALYVSAGVSVPVVPVAAPQPEIEQGVQRANELVTAIDTRVQTSVPWTPQVAQALSLMPNELTLTTIAVSDTTKDLTIEGISRSRASLVAYEQAIRALPWAGTVTSPLQNFATGTQTSFSIVIKRAAP